MGNNQRTQLMKPVNPTQNRKVRNMLLTKTTSRIILGTLLGAVTIGLTSNPANALTPLDLIKIPLNAVNGDSQKPLPNRNIDVFKENLNGNNLNICVSPAPCSPPNVIPRPRPLPSKPVPPPQVKKPLPPQQTTPQPRNSQPKAPPRQPSSGPVLSIPPIKLF